MLQKVIINNTEIPISFISELYINESIYSPITSGSLMLNDTGFKNNLLSYNINNNVSLICYDVIKDTELMFNYIVTENNTTNITTTQLYNNTIIDFASYYLINLYSVDYSYYYKQMKVSDVVSNILKSANIRLNYITKTKDNIDYTIPYTSRYNTIKDLFKYSSDENNVAGFMLFPNLLDQKMNFVNYTDLWNEKIGKYDKILINDMQDDQYIGAIFESSVINEYNLNDFVKSGLTNLNSISFDVDSGEIININNNITKVLNDINISGYLPLDEKLIDIKNTKVNNNIINNKNSILIESNDQLINYSNNILKLELTTYGDYNRKLGMIVDVLIKKNIYDETDYNIEYTGSYIISDIQHRFEAKRYMQILTVSRIGFNDSKVKGIIKY